MGRSDEPRLCERWSSSAESVFRFDRQAPVAKSSRAGIPRLKWSRDQAGDRLHFWPFDGWQPVPGKSLVAEVHPSIFRNRCRREGRTAHERVLADLEGWILRIR